MWSAGDSAVSDTKNEISLRTTMGYRYSSVACLFRTIYIGDNITCVRECTNVYNRIYVVADGGFVKRAAGCRFDGLYGRGRAAWGQYSFCATCAFAAWWESWPWWQLTKVQTGRCGTCTYRTGCLCVPCHCSIVNHDITKDKKIQHLYLTDDNTVLPKP